MTDVDREPGHQQWTVTSGIGADTGVPFVVARSSWPARAWR
jgi:hypothetical protein